METPFLSYYNIWKSNHSLLNMQELILLYNAAKDAYYNGEEIMSDVEFDELEEQIGKTNTSYIGSKRGNYTKKHAFIMGSLSKVQIKENSSKDKTVNWNVFATAINSHLRKASAYTSIEVTPKLDGCSFSAEFKNMENEAVLMSCATRGDGTFGTDIEKWFDSVVSGPYWNMIDEAVTHFCANNSDDILCIRGEVLIPYSAFNERYQTKFTNPRSFVAGCLGQKWENTAEQMEYSGALHFVCYDYRVVDGKTGKYKELDWIDSNDPTYKEMKPFLNHIGELPDLTFCEVINDKTIDGQDLEAIYTEFDDYRMNTSNYALDGVVFKPNASGRVYNAESRERPLDCVAMKFMPMINPTKIVDIEWSVGKDGEYTPVAIFEPITLDSKDITRASLHNYNYIMLHNVGIGSLVRISLAGDIIPFIYEVVEASGTENINLPDDGYIVTDQNSGCMHLMKNFTEDGRSLNLFLASAKSLGITNVGPAAAKMLWEGLHSTLTNMHPELGDTLNNIIQLIPAYSRKEIIDVFGKSKTIMNIVESLTTYGERIEVSDVIRSFCFPNCGNRASILCAKLLAGVNASTANFPGESYQWAFNPKSNEYQVVMNALKYLNLSLESVDEPAASADTVYVIMTGSPKNFGYDTKADFLAAHPNYVETGSWTECNCLFTDNPDSTSGKMKKAQKAGVKILTYDQEYK